MIVLDDRSSGRYSLLTKREQVKGSQTWLDDYPAGIHARCHFYDGEFSLEGVEITVRCAADILGSYGDTWEMYDITEAIEEKMAHSDLSEEEFNCMVNKGFLHLLALRFPEIMKNKTYNFIIRGIDKVQQLEKMFEGKSIEDIKNYISTQLEIANEDDKKMFKAIKSIYENGINWINAGRKEYLNYQETQPNVTQSPHHELNRNDDEGR